MKNVTLKEELPNGYKIAEVSLPVRVYENNEYVLKEIKKYALSDGNNIINLKDTNGNLVPILYFDKYEVDEFGNLIIGVAKEGYEVYHRLINNFDLSSTRGTTETDYDLIGGIVIKNEQHYSPTKKIEDIIDEKYYYNYGVINKEGILTVYPTYDYACFANEDACIVGNLWDFTKLKFGKLKYGYVNITTGENITPVAFYQAEKFFCGRAAVKSELIKSNSWGYVDRDKVMTNIKDNNDYADNLHPQFYRACDFEDGEAKVCTGVATILTSRTWIDVDTKGNLVKKMNNRSIR